MKGRIMELYYTVLAGIFGLVAGSFSNVCICSLPKKEDFTHRRSHCMSCGTTLKWYDLIPVASYIFLRGKCRYCGNKISVQYPAIELLTCIAYTVIFKVKGPSLLSVLYCLFASALIILSVIDIRTREIPFGINVFIGIVGIAVTAADYTNWYRHITGAFCVSIPLFIVYLATHGIGMGGGDIKLSVAAGLVLGWKATLTGFFLACILGTVLHLIIMKVKKADHSLAFGPYLAMGFYIALLYGEQLLYLMYGI